MSAIEVVKVPNIGDFEQVEIIEVLVKPGDMVALEDPLITLETDKATMDVPSPLEGKIESLEVNVGDKVSEGDVILKVQGMQQESAVEKSIEAAPESSPTPKIEEIQVDVKSIELQAQLEPVLKKVKLPDSDDFKDVTVIEILVNTGDVVEKDQSLVAVESEKASLELPSPYAGVIEKIFLQLGQKANPGEPVVEILAQPDSVEIETQTHTEIEEDLPESTVTAPAQKPLEQPQINQEHYTQSGEVHAGPATRKFARSLGVDLSQVKGSGHKNRITTKDVEHYVKNTINKIESGQSQGTGLPQIPEVDFSQFGEIETVPMNRIKKLTARNMHRNWVNIPHVTQFDEADITELEEFRKENKKAALDNGIPLTPVSFIIKAVISALKTFPQFNASLAPNGEDIIFKKYYHVGVAVDTPNGLLVPVIRDVNNKGLFEIAKELAGLSEKAKKGSLKSNEMQGNTFTISSLGNMGGTQFTPIINAPDVAILGVSKLQIKPVFMQQEFVPRKHLPLALSYDHRVIDGVEGAKFLKHICTNLQDIRKLLL